jgi:uncharacterized protein (DUF2236 family)
VVAVPKEVMDGYVGYPSDQCLIEVLDYWLRHHPGQLMWEEVAQALREMKHYQVAEKALQISTTGQFLLLVTARFFPTPVARYVHVWFITLYQIITIELRCIICSSTCRKVSTRG